ncbi:DUF3906 family protein [Paenibacillus sp. 1001270B_150601_E10]|uniref:DUF3906 family protein n=1 Tax=Paenibacillus sp. 1001270B_150601_E10 TaxID=2787079 RepID=UPI001E581791|nr:DUF3906 family protein [Paenibacillus sp. 1001270B_150601_E10]
MEMSNMYLYRLEASSSNQQLDCVVIAGTEEEAFQQAEVLMDKGMMDKEWDELSIVEKKRLSKGAGYVFVK